MPRIPQHAFRGVVFETLRSDFGNQWLSLVDAVAAVAANQGVVAKPAESSRRPRLEPADQELLRSVVWQLVSAGIITIGANNSNPDWPFLSVTEYGRKVLAEPDPDSLPYDPEGYVERLLQRSPDLGDVVTQAVGEASRCLSRGTHWAATIMLGVASEALLREVLADVAGAIASDERQRRFVEETSPATISRAFQRLQGVLDSVRVDLPRELEDGLDTTLSGVFGMIRLSRNEAGHPTTVPSVDAATVHARLVLFLEYAAFSTKLRAWLKANPLP